MSFANDFSVSKIVLDPVLLVEPNKTLRNVLKKALQDSGYETIEADTAENAINLLSSNPVSLIMLDSDLPTGVDAYELCKSFKNFSSGTVPIVMLSQNDGFEVREKGYRSGITDIVKKGVRLSYELPECVNKHLKPELPLLGAHCLLVDDSKMDLRVLEKVLVPLGATVVTAESAEKALEIIKNEPDRFDLITLDYNMPGMSGLELCKIIRERLGLKETPIFFLSGESDRETKLNYFREGANDYLQKPFIREELVARVKVHVNTRKKWHETLSLNAELERSNRSLAEFAHVAAHDLKAPLQSMKMGTELLIDFYGDKIGEKGVDQLKRISGSIDRMATMVRGLLSFAEIGGKDKKRETVDLNIIAKNLYEDVLVTLHAKEATLTFTELPVVKGNPTQLSQLLGNLVSNALKYQKKDGTKPEVKVESSRASKKNFNEKDENSQWKTGEEDGWVIRISDNGIGFDNSQAESVFGLFKRLVGYSEYEGSGIGLATCKKLVEDHGGKIAAWGEAGIGATFSIYFPDGIILNQ